MAKDYNRECLICGRKSPASHLVVLKKGVWHSSVCGDHTIAEIVLWNDQYPKRIDVTLKLVKEE